jgi:transcriptional regulator with XRE-family HTH domain
VKARPRRQISPASQALARAGLTQQQLAELTGQARAYIGDQLSGRRRPTPALIPVLAALAGPVVANEIEELLRERWAEDGEPIRPAEPRRRHKRRRRRSSPP